VTARSRVAGVVFAIAVAVAFYLLLRPDGGETTERVTIVEVQGDAASEVLTLVVEHARCEGDPRAHAEESGDVVRLWADQEVGGGCDDVGLRSVLDVELEAPVGPKRVEVELPPDRSAASSDLACSIAGGGACRLVEAPG